MNAELIAIGERIRQQLPAYREAFAFMLATGRYPAGMWPDAQEIFTDLNDWYRIAILEPLPAELRPSVAKLGALVTKGHPAYGFQEGVVSWADTWEPIWDRARGAIVPAAGEWEYVKDTNIWVKDGETKTVKFGGAPSELLAELLAMNPREKKTFERGTDMDTIAKRIRVVCKELGLKVKIRASLKDWSIMRVN